MLNDNPERRLGGLDFILSRCAETYPNRIALDDRLNKIELTYAQLRERSIRLARALMSLGVKKGDRVGYAFYNEHPSIETLFACATLGAVAVPLNNRLSPVETVRHLDAQQCHVFIFREELTSLGDGAKVEHHIVRGKLNNSEALDYEALLTEQSGTPLSPAARWEDPYMIAMTGGTTGGSKGAVWTHGGAIMDILALLAPLGLRRGDNTICFAPLYHAAGLGYGFFPTFWLGGKVIFPDTPSFSPQFLHNVIKSETIHCMFIVPAMINPIYKTWDGEPITSMVSLSVASAPTPKVLRLKLKEMFPETQLMVAYGMTESISGSMQLADDFLVHADGVGEPLLGSRIRIVDDEGRILPNGQVGQIVMRTLAMALYYNNEPESTKNTFMKCQDDPEGLEWIYTGDIGMMDEAGRVTILDRSKDIIITGGENVASVEVENMILHHPNVYECAVIGLPDDQWGELVCGIIVKADQSISDLQMIEEIIALCKEKLGAYKVPKKFTFTDALPRTPFGKVLKRELRNMDVTKAISATDVNQLDSKLIV
jgi:fatty-acyl-CoA synthase